MNLCHSSDVPEPDFDYPDDRLAEILDSGGDMQVDDIRIPMSIGELHRDTDKSMLSSQSSFSSSYNYIFDMFKILLVYFSQVARNV